MEDEEIGPELSSAGKFVTLTKVLEEAEILRPRSRTDDRGRPKCEDRKVTPQASMLPEWVLVLQALLTPAIAIAVAVIAFLQWRTAHQKVVLDLFDRRWKAAEAIKQSLIPIFRDGRIRQSNDVLTIYGAMRDAHFLFGKDVNRLLARYKTVIAHIGVGSSYTESPTNARYQEGVDLLHNNMLELIKFHDEFDAVCSRYMGMDQKLIRWPWTILIAWAAAFKRKLWK